MAAAVVAMALALAAPCTLAQEEDVKADRIAFAGQALGVNMAFFEARPWF